MLGIGLAAMVLISVLPIGLALTWFIFGSKGGWSLEKK